MTICLWLGIDIRLFTYPTSVFSWYFVALEIFMTVVCSILSLPLQERKDTSTNSTRSVKGRKFAIIYMAGCGCVFLMLGVLNIDPFLSLAPFLPDRTTLLFGIWLIGKIVVGALFTFGMMKAFRILVMEAKKNQN